MKTLHINRRQILRAIHAACVALFLAASATASQASTILISIGVAAIDGGGGTNTAEIIPPNWNFVNGAPIDTGGTSTTSNLVTNTGSTTGITMSYINPNTSTQRQVYGYPTGSVINQTTAGGVAVGNTTTPSIIIPGGTPSSGSSAGYATGPAGQIGRFLNGQTVIYTLSGLDSSGATDYTITLYGSVTLNASSGNQTTLTLTNGTTTNPTTLVYDNRSNGTSGNAVTTSFINVIPDGTGTISWTGTAPVTSQQYNGIGVIELDSAPSGVPEPTTTAFLSLGAIGLLFASLRRRFFA